MIASVAMPDDARRPGLRNATTRSTNAPTATAIRRIPKVFGSSIADGSYATRPAPVPQMTTTRGTFGEADLQAASPRSRAWAEPASTVEVVDQHEALANRLDRLERHTEVLRERGDDLLRPPGPELRVNPRPNPDQDGLIAVARGIARLD